jgi:anti-sigma-K factor RskA
MRMRQSLAQFEAAFYEETVEDRRRRERLRRQAAQRSYVRRVQKRTKHGNWRFVVLLLAMVATAVIVAVAMFQTLTLFFA